LKKIFLKIIIIFQGSLDFHCFAKNKFSMEFLDFPAKIETANPKAEFL
jgi:hypothetical protein